MLKLEASRTGLPTAVIRGAYLHSRYDPVAEAVRFAREALGTERPSRIVLLGAGLGYLLQALRRQGPSVPIIPVYYDGSVFEQAVACLSAESQPRGSAVQLLQVAWHPGSPTTLLEHLRSAIPELEGEGLAVLEWPVSARLFPEVSKQANRAVQQLLREHRGSLVTTTALGTRWLRNAFRNFVYLEELIPEPPPPGAPVCITASGPSLEESLPLIAPYRDRLCLWALPSAVPALRDCGLHPDLVVVTDPGYYALAHLHCAAGMGLHLAMPLSAACGAWSLGAAVVAVSQGTFFEGALLELRGLSPAILPASGTVAASALALARQVGADEVVFAGLDLCPRDIRSHTRPNAFDRFIADGVDRLSPYLHRLFSRQAERRADDGRTLHGSSGRRVSDLALDTYAGWFAGLNRDLVPRTYRLLPSEVRLPAFDDLNDGGFRRWAEALPRAVRNPPLPPPASAPSPHPGAAPSSPAARRRQAHALLERWGSSMRHARGQLSGGRLEALLGEPVLMSLCYYTNAAALSEVRRLARLAGLRQASDRLESLATESVGLLENIQSSLAEG